MNLNAKVGIGAVFKLIVRKAETDEIVRETPEFCNLVLTTGLAQMAVGTWIDRCCVGTGNSTPVASQVALNNFLASTTAIATGATDTGGLQVTTTPYYWYGRRTWRFAVGVATGNISEIGLGWGNATLWNRALIKDTSGNTATIAVLADEYLDVISEVRVYPKESTSSISLVDKVGNVISTHEVKIMPYFQNGESNVKWEASRLGFGASSDALRASSNDMPLTAGGLPESAMVGPAVAMTYSSSSMMGTVVVTSSQLNFSHRTFFTAIKGLMIFNTQWVERVPGYKWQFNPPIPKDAETILTYKFTLNWGNYAPE